MTLDVRPPIFLLSLVLSLQGCSDSSSLSSAPHKPSSDVRNMEERADIFANILEDNLGTSGTLKSDYRATIEFLHSNPIDESFSAASVSPIANLINGLDSSVVTAREVWKKSNSSRKNISTGILKLLIFCRLMRNASLITDHQCRKQYVRAASAAMIFKQNENIEDRDGKYETLGFFCGVMMKNEALCREFPLRYSVAIGIVQVNRVDRERETKFYSVFRQFVKGLMMRRVEFKRCNTLAQREAYFEYYEEIFNQLRRVLDTPDKPGTCLDNIVEDILVRIDAIDKRLGGSLNCL